MAPAEKASWKKLHSLSGLQEILDSPLTLSAENFYNGGRHMREKAVEILRSGEEKDIPMRKSEKSGNFISRSSGTGNDFEPQR